MTATNAKPGVLPLSDARLHYELRGSGPLLVLVGAPMDARAFEPLADLLASDFTVLTTDPRGIFRSPVNDREADATVELRAADLARLITHAGGGPAVVLGSSGGAISALCLTQTQPELVSTLVAHEPPLDQLLDDRDELLAKTEAMIETYAAGDRMGAWRQFMSIANIQMPPEVLEQMFGGERDAQALADEAFQYAHMLRPTVYFRPDVARLRRSGTSIVVAIGEESAGELCDRTSRALASALGIEPTMFPGGHIGFAERPQEFARRLREVLRASRRERSPATTA